jgi:hypothetical protein
MALTPRMLSSKIIDAGDKDDMGVRRFSTEYWEVFIQGAASHLGLTFSGWTVYAFERFVIPLLLGEVFLQFPRPWSNSAEEPVMFRIALSHSRLQTSQKQTLICRPLHGAFSLNRNRWFRRTMHQDD